MGAEAKAIYQSLPWVESFPAQTAAPPAISTLSFWIRSRDTNTLMMLSLQVQDPSHRIWGSLNDPQVGFGGELSGRRAPCFQSRRVPRQATGTGPAAYYVVLPHWVWSIRSVTPA
jgi:hypothetical protein